MSDRTTVTVYQDDLETYKSAKRKLQAERDEDLALREALTLLSEAYLDGRLEVPEDDDAG